jgi:hypothetical protein
MENAMLEWAEYFAAAKTVLDLFKAVKDDLPKGEQADKAQKQIEKAEAALKNSEAEFAKSVGYRLCRCTFPPQIMLWKNDIRKNVCPECGDVFPPERGDAPRQEGGWVRARRGGR